MNVIIIIMGLIVKCFSCFVEGKEEGRERG